MPVVVCCRLHHVLGVLHILLEQQRVLHSLKTVPPVNVHSSANMSWARLTFLVNRKKSSCTIYSILVFIYFIFVLLDLKSLGHELHFTKHTFT